MPVRNEKPITNNIYHVINRSEFSLFKYANDYKRFIDTFVYYQYKDTPIKFSLYLDKEDEEKENILNNLEIENKKNVNILAYCLMPTHFHFLIQQINKNGIKNFVSKTSISYSKYYNLKYSRKGPLFYNRYKSIAVLSDESYLHLTRYIHLNPYSANIVSSFYELYKYKYSSLPEYLDFSKQGITVREIIKKHFIVEKNYIKFIEDHADYQRSLQFVKQNL